MGHSALAFSYKGTATEISLDYFSTILLPLKGKTDLIKSLLMAGMGKFKAVSEMSKENYTSGQIICLVSPSFVFGNSGIIQYSMIGNLAS